MWPPWRKSSAVGDNSHRLASDDSQAPIGPVPGSEEEKSRDGVARLVSPEGANAEDLAKRELTVGEGWDCTGFTFPTWRKWSILAAVFIVQISMNYNASAYANAVSGLTEEYGISNFQARLGQMVFLVAYVS